MPYFEVGNFPLRLKKSQDKEHQLSSNLVKFSQKKLPLCHNICVGNHKQKLTKADTHTHMHMCSINSSFRPWYLLLFLETYVL